MLLESKGNCAFKKAGKIQGRGETNAFDAKVSPLPIYLPETHGEFRAAPKNAVHFLYGAVLHRPGGTPGPLNLFCDTELGFNLFCDTELGFNLFCDAELGFNLFCDAELCFCRLCNFDLPNKQRFSLQRHKNCKKLRFLWQYVL